MRLHWSPASPFVRMVMMVAHEHALLDRIALVRTRVAMSDPNPELLRDNPLSRLPTLVLDDGLALFDSRVIYRYLDTIGAGPRLMPAGARALVEAMRAEALGHGLCELLVLWRNERGRSPALQSAAHLAAFELKVGATLDRMEAEADERSGLPFDFGHIAAGCALAYCDYRFPDLAWREGRPRLARWHAGFAQRPSALATVIAS